MTAAMPVITYNLNRPPPSQPAEPPADENLDLARLQDLLLLIVRKRQSLRPQRAPPRLSGPRLQVVRRKPFSSRTAAGLAVKAPHHVAPT